MKTIEDYYEQMYELFPTLPKEDVRKIMRYGWSNLMRALSWGCDINLTNGSSFHFHVGLLFKHSLTWGKVYILKLARKFRFIAKLKDIPWDGYYYFTLSPERHEKILNQLKKDGTLHKKKKINYENIMVYKLKDEAILRSIGQPYLYRMKRMLDIGNIFYFPEVFDKNKIEFMYKIELPPTITSRLVTNYKYETLAWKKQQSTPLMKV